jgi:cell division protein YceG involved in septum cleavage
MLVLLTTTIIGAINKVLLLVGVSVSFLIVIALGAFWFILDHSVSFSDRPIEKIELAINRNFSRLSIYLEIRDKAIEANPDEIRIVVDGTTRIARLSVGKGQYYNTWHPDSIVVTVPNPKHKERIEEGINKSKETLAVEQKKLEESDEKRITKIDLN